MTRPLKALIVANVLGLLALALVLFFAPPRVARDGQPSAFPYQPVDAGPVLLDSPTERGS